MLPFAVREHRPGSGIDARVRRSGQGHSARGGAAVAAVGFAAESKTAATTLDFASGVGWRYRRLISPDVCPTMSSMIRRSTPAAAAEMKPWRGVWGPSTIPHDESADVLSKWSWHSLGVNAAASGISRRSTDPARPRSVVALASPDLCPVVRPRFLLRATSPAWQDDDRPPGCTASHVVNASLNRVVSGKAAPDSRIGWREWISPVSRANTSRPAARAGR